MQIEIDEDEISIINMTMKKRDVRGMQIGDHALLDDKDFRTIDAKNIDSRNDFSVSKR